MKIIKFNSINSTNEYLKHEYKNLDNFTIVYAAKQKHGKGRNKHIWESEDNKNLLCSILLKDKKLNKKGALLSLITAVAIVKLLQKLKLKNISIKWPNDIYINDKKICGILLESKSINNNIECIVIGIGLNLNQTKFNKKYRATSYKLEKKKNVVIEDVLNLLIKELKDELNDKNFITFVNKFNYLKNKQVYVTINKKREKVLAKNINKNGSLNVKYKNKIYQINSNEINLIKD